MEQQQPLPRCGCSLLPDLNPLSKAVYVLRCFYGRARLTAQICGPDCSACGPAARQRPPAFLVGLAVAGVAHADDATSRAALKASPSTQVSPETLDDAIQSTLQKDEFAWRTPKPPEEKHDEGFIERAVHQFFHLVHEGLRIIFKPIGEFFKWLLSSSREHDGGSVGAGVMGAIPWGALFWIALILAVALLVWLIVRNLRPSTTNRGHAPPVHDTGKDNRS